MFDSAVFDVVVGLVFLLATFSVIVTVATEGVSRVLGWRSQQLVEGLRALVDGDSSATSTITSTFRLLRSPFIGSLGQKGRAAPSSGTDVGLVPIDGESAEERAKRESRRAAASQPLFPDEESLIETVNARKPDDPQLSWWNWWKKIQQKRPFWRKRRRLPSYIASRQFASAVLGEVLPTDLDRDDSNYFPTVRANITQQFGDSALAETLNKILDEVGGNVDQVRTRLETAYDDHMTRVSGWYKRNTRKVQLVAAAVIIVVFNVNLLRIADHLNDNDTTRAAVVAIAENTACDGDLASDETAQCVQDSVDRLATTNLPVLWQDQCEPGSDDCDFLVRKGLAGPNWNDDVWSVLGNLAVFVLGYGLAWLGLVPGSRFWFDALSRLNSLRSGGKPPPSTADEKG